MLGLRQVVAVGARSSALLRQPAAARALRAAAGVPSRAFASREAPATPTSDDRMIGPYPVVPREHYNRRRQDIKWDDQQGRRNLGEPVHHQFDMLDVWSPDELGNKPDSDAARYNLYFISIIVGFSAWCYYIFEGPQFVRRQYPHGGLYKALGGTEESKETFQAREDHN